MTPGSNQHKDVSTVISSLPREKAESLIGFAMDLHIAVRAAAKVPPKPWQELSDSLRDHYLRIAIATDGRRSAFFGTC